MTKLEQAIATALRLLDYAHDSRMMGLGRDPEKYSSEFSISAETLRAVATDQLVPAQAWQPIESAPKGKWILLLVKTDYGPRIVKAEYVAKFGMESEGDLDGYGDWNEQYGVWCHPEGWYEAVWYSDEYSAFRVTDEPVGWMPLPPPPAEVV